jgi:hypothetical protein
VCVCVVAEQCLLHKWPSVSTRTVDVCPRGYVQYTPSVMHLTDYFLSVYSTWITLEGLLI